MMVGVVVVRLKGMVIGYGEGVRVSGLERGVAVVVVDSLLVGAPEQRLGLASTVGELAPPGGCPERGLRQNSSGGRKVEVRPRD